MTRRDRVPFIPFLADEEFGDRDFVDGPALAKSPSAAWSRRPPSCGPAHDQVSAMVNLETADVRRSTSRRRLLENEETASKVPRGVRSSVSADCLLLNWPISGDGQCSPTPEYFGVHEAKARAPSLPGRFGPFDIRVHLCVALALRTDPKAWTSPLAALAAAYLTAGFPRSRSRSTWISAVLARQFGGSFLAACSVVARLDVAGHPAAGKACCIMICSAVAMTVCFLNAMRLTTVADAEQIDAIPSSPRRSPGLYWASAKAWTLVRPGNAFAGMADGQARMRAPDISSAMRWPSQRRCLSPVIVLILGEGVSMVLEETRPARRSFGCLACRCRSMLGKEFGLLAPVRHR